MAGFKKAFPFAIFFCVSLFAFSVSNAVEMVGYYASWKWYQRDKLVNPLTINYKNYTIINYAFFKPLENGDVVEGDSYADEILLLGNPSMQNGKTINDTGSSLVVNAHRNNVKVILSIGGGKWSTAFATIANDSLKRKRFVTKCISLIQKYNLDGIDIDWEFPSVDNGGSHGYTLLLSDLRSAMNFSPKGKKLILTIAVGPAPKHMSAIEWNVVAPLVDLVHLMAYNYHGAWDNLSNHNAPLYITRKGSPLFNINSSLDLLVNTFGVPSNKITLGMAFYGRSVKMSASSGLFEPTTGKPDNTTFPESSGTPPYYKLMSCMHLFERKWDPVSMVPYLKGKNQLSTFVSYDDTQSVRIKAEYVLEKKLAGIVAWDIAGECVVDLNSSTHPFYTPLSDTVTETFKNSQKIKTPFIFASASTDSRNSFPFLIYPSIISDLLFLKR
jgi:GH18 family chitinase